MIRAAVAVTFGVGLLAFGAGGYVQLDPGEIGLLMKQFGDDKGMQKEYLTAGTYWVNPITYDVVVYDSRSYQEVIEDMPASTKDGQPILVDFSVELSLEGENVANLHQDIGRDYYGRVVYPALRSSVRNATSAVLSDQIYTGEGRDIVQDLIQQYMTHKLESVGINILVNLRDVQFTNRDFVTALENKAIAGQLEEINRRKAAGAAQEAKRVENIAEGEKQRRIKEAEAGAEELRQQGIGQRALKEETAKGILAVGKAEAEVIQLRNAAMNGEGGDRIVQMEWARNLGPNVKVYGIPTGSPGTTSLMDLNGLVGGALKGVNVR